MSGSVGSAWPSENLLFNAASGGATAEVARNQLLNQQTQQTIGSNEIEMMSRAAATLMDPSQYPTPEARAAAYPTLLGTLQRQGFAKSAPATYPGDDAIAGLARMGMSLKDQYGAGMIISPALKALMDAPIPGVPGYGGAGGGGGGAAPLSSDKATALKQIAQRESGGDPTALNYVAREDPTAYDRGATASGKYQIVNSTWAEGAALAGVDVSKYPTARSAPEAVQDQVASALWDKHGNAPWQKGAQDWVKGPGGRYALQTVAAPGAPAGAPTAPPAVQQGGAPPAPPGSPAGNYDGGGFGRAMTVNPNAGGPQYTVKPPPVIRAAPIPASRTGQVAGDVGAIQAGMALAQATPGLPGGAVAAGPAAPTATATATPGTPEPGWGSGGGVGSYGAGSFGGPAAPAAPPPTAVAQTPPPQAQAPAVPPSGTGVNSPQYQAAMALNHRAMQLEALGGNNPVVKARVAELRQQAQLMMQADSVVQTPQGQVHTLTGKIDDPAKPLADYRETSPGSGIWVGGPGTEPRFQPPGRLVVGPDGTVWQTGVSGAHVLQPSDPQAIAARKEAEASGTATGTAVAKQLPDLMTQARNAAAQEGQIDYATNQLREATKGGVPTGYFSGALATAAAAAKSLGIDTSALGVDPKAVGNIQTAQKTLSVIGGAILRQALGPGSAITDGKIEAFIHTQPGIETDPQALERIMGWARSQYTYERELGRAAVTEAAKPENAGRLPPHWLAAYYRDHGFAPIYDQGSQEMQQPDGRQPTRETPPAATLPAAARSSLKEGHETTFGNGQVWTLRNGQPVQVR